MINKYLLNFFTLSLGLFSLVSCEKVFESDSYEAYFGGEIINPQDSIVLFLKDGKVIDTIRLDKNNRFLHKFDSLAPGLYTFQHAPEYQYVFFDKNDSLMIRLNSYDFDNSLAFCGRGDEKNNYLINQFLLNEKEKNDLYDLLDKDFKSFEKTIDSAYNIRKSDYLRRRSEIAWSEEFDKVAQAGIDLNYFYKKELYPSVHQYKTGEPVYTSLPKDYYDYRKTIDFTNPQLTNYSPFIKYVTSMLNNITYVKNNFVIDENSLESNVYKLNVADSIIKNKTIKNVILNNIAYMYLLQDQNMCSNRKFIDRYLELSSDTEQQSEVRSIFDAIQNLKAGNPLPAVKLVDTDFEPVPLVGVTNNKPIVVFFWTTQANSHLKSVHRKVSHYKELYPNVTFIGININDSNENWTKALKQNELDNTIIELKSSDFSEIKQKWVITKIHRTIILNPDGTIKNAFANLFDAKFGDQLK